MGWWARVRIETGVHEKLTDGRFDIRKNSSKLFDKAVFLLLKFTCIQ